MEKLYLWSRLLAGFFGFTTLLGIIWFYDSLHKAVIVAGLLMAFSSIPASLMSPRVLHNKGVRGLLVVLCILGIGAGLVLVADDLRGSLSNVEWDVVAIRLLHVSALGVLAARALELLPEPTKLA